MHGQQNIKKIYLYLCISCIMYSCRHVYVCNNEMYYLFIYLSLWTYIWLCMNYIIYLFKREVYRVLLGKPEGKRPLGRPRRRWVDNIRMDLQEVGCGYMDWIGLAQDRDRWPTLVSAVMNLRVPWNAGNFFTSCKPVSFSRRTPHHGVIYLGNLIYMYVSICHNQSA